MNPISLPTDDPRLVFETCVGGLQDARLRRRMTSAAQHIAIAAERYRIEGQRRSLFAIQSHQTVGTITASEMGRLYKNKLARKGSTGREIYNRLLASPPHGRCPLCAQRVVSTLDHYLPSSKFPSLAVVPANLIPSCQDCNKAKSDRAPSSAVDQTLHPYFDNVGQGVWLHATVVEASPVAVTYSVVAPAGMAPLTFNRVKLHFNVFGLADLYGSHAAQELVDIRFSMRSLLDASSPTEVQQRLIDDYDSRRAIRVNAWQTALYRAISASHWYCNGGFDL